MYIPVRREGAGGFRAKDEAEKEIPKEFHVSIHLYSHALILIPRLLIATTLLTRASAGRRAGVALKCARNAREDAKEESEYHEIRRRSRSGDNERGVNHSEQTVLLQTARRDGDSVFRAAQHPRAGVAYANVPSEFRERELLVDSGKNATLAMRRRSIAVLLAVDYSSAEITSWRVISRDISARYLRPAILEEP